MPAANGQFYLSDFTQELRELGFDGFSSSDLVELINRGYFHVARKFPVYWKEFTDDFTISVGSYNVTLGTELPNFHTVDHVYVTAPAGERRKLRVMDDAEFKEKWLPLSLGDLQNRGAVDSYYIYEGKLWVLRPPDVEYSFTAHYHRRPVKMVNSGDLPITPMHLDEAIVIAAKIRCHKRASEPGLAAVAEGDLQEFFDDMLDDEEMLMAEQQDRVKPDDTWL